MFLTKITFNKKNVLFYFSKYLLSPCEKHRWFKILIFLDQVDWLASFSWEFSELFIPRSIDECDRCLVLLPLVLDCHDYLPIGLMAASNLFGICRTTQLCVSGMAENRARVFMFSVSTFAASHREFLCSQIFSNWSFRNLLASLVTQPIH